MPVINELTTYPGENFAPTFTMNPVEDITGWTIVFTLKVSMYAPNPPLLAINATLVSPTTGVFRVTLTAAQTEALAPGNYVYDVQRTNPGAEAVLSIGTFRVLADVRTA